ncbi:MAG: molybdate ABC transporter substrate-binding protein [Candidatus Wallbacteria bacterium HGW-Wallbacteria-1]|jgi:molybdate transport system substrate-binding protein|uniref:Molybdate ABC transporter substrate-binding protein n=1 Tax=Candidatus Wallbacteria bacterium HGW-Wallbacteria-1 TaxID=2013854 RepID=A0A2N1PND4_9BACT|nr:MAG: molybdate ABC transporter substrate-binding protein [Candidatus Wallbacteria bacterium HGW-Wallbacteria-1]
MSEFKRPIALLFVIILMMCFNSSVSSAESRELLISAAASLTDAVTEISEAFMRQNPDILVRCNFASSGALRRQIEMGVLPDLYLSASMKQVELLLEKKIVASENIRDFVSNTIVVAVPSDSGDKITDLKDLLKMRGKIAIGTPGVVPAGTYAREAMEKAGIYKAMEERGAFVFADSVRQVVHYVTTGNVSAGIVFGTDQVLFASKFGKGYSIPDQMHTRIRYAMVTFPGRDSASALKFHEFVRNSVTRRIMEKYGFIWNIPAEDGNSLSEVKPMEKKAPHP